VARDTAINNANATNDRSAPKRRLKSKEWLQCLDGRKMFISCINPTFEWQCSKMAANYGIR